MSQEDGESSSRALASRTSFTVQFDDGSSGFTAGADEPLLHAAARAGVMLSSSCRNGSCRTCMCRLLSGRVGYRIQWPGLLPEEKAEGWILACIAYPESDLVLRRGPPIRDWRTQSLPVV
jgi:ferredoxin